jgi:chromosomal replication initiation ATPase DnaA
MKLVKKVSPVSILEAVSKVSGFTVPELSTGTNRGTVSDWRHIGMFIARERGLTLTESGELFGRHFTTATAAERRVRSKLKDESVQSAIERVNKLIEEQQDE